jgi:hypothetical protein
MSVAYVLLPGVCFDLLAMLCLQLRQSMFASTPVQQSGHVVAVVADTCQPVSLPKQSWPFVAHARVCQDGMQTTTQLSNMLECLSLSVNC